MVLDRPLEIDLEWVRKADPLRDHPAEGWSDTDAAAVMLRRITADGQPAQTPTGGPGRRRRSVPLLVVAAALLVLAAGAAEARHLWGAPAPAEVRRDLLAVDQGMPADLRLNPDVHNARLVAQADGARLYAADLVDGGYCAEIVTPDDRAAGAVCASTQTQHAIDVTAPFVDPVTMDSPVVVGGRVNVAGAASIDVAYHDGGDQSVALGEEGFFVFAVSTAHIADAHRHGFSLVATDQSGTRVADAEMPPTDFSDPLDDDAKQPIFVSTISTHLDFTKVLGIEGSVNVVGAAALELRYPDGSVAQVPLDADGRYRYDLPSGRQDDLFDEPGHLVALDARGNEITSVPVAAVAYWRLNE